MEEPMEILEREFKKLKRSRIAIVNVRWNSKRGPEFTWEHEDHMRLNYANKRRKPLEFSVGDYVLLKVSSWKGVELFTSFDQCLIDEVTEVQNVFKQMELAVEQHREEKHKFQNKMENVLQENDRLFTQALSVEILNVVVHDNVKSDYLNVDVCAHCVTIEFELKKDFIKKECYEMLLQQYHTLEKHCISLEVNNQLKKEIFQKNTLSSSESAPTFAEFFEINELKAQAQAKDTVILHLKEKLRSLKGDVTERNVKRKVGEMETLNIELDHK
nr:putative reverse transcriptase domain-containing protein [Tanacetum cinerariifolium]